MVFFHSFFSVQQTMCFGCFSANVEPVAFTDLEAAHRRQSPHRAAPFLFRSKFRHHKCCGFRTQILWPSLALSRKPWPWVALSGVEAQQSGWNRQAPQAHATSNCNTSLFGFWKLPRVFFWKGMDRSCFEQNKKATVSNHYGTGQWLAFVTLSSIGTALFSSRCECLGQASKLSGMRQQVAGLRGSV